MKRITKTMGWLVVAAALTMASAACSGSEDGMTAEPTPTPAGNTDAKKKYTMTVTASKGGDALTRALSYDSGTKGLSATWKAGEKVKVYTLNLNNYTFGDLLGELTALSDGASTTLSGEIDEPSAGTFLALVFPRYPVTYTGQKGTLDDIAANFDYATAYISNYTVTEGGTITYEKPVTFENQQAIVRFTLRDKDDNAIQATSLTISDLDDYLIQSLEGSTPTYGELTIPPETPASEIWAALAIHYPSMHISMTATTEDGETYIYTKEGVKFNPGEFYSITVKMERIVDLSQASGNITLRNGDTATGTMPTGKVYIADGATVTLSDVTVTNGISCNGSVTINLEGANTVGGSGYSGIEIGPGTLTIQGSGSLTATGRDGGAGIGGSSSNCHVVIKGGTIVAQGSSAYSSVSGAGIGGRGEHFGNITIEGGDVTATGGENAAGIGGGHAGTPSCGNITISGGTVRATGGANAAGIGCGCANYGNTSTCGDITISGGTVTATAGTITDSNNPYVSAIGLAASLVKIGTVTVTDGINSVAMTNSTAGTSIGSFIYGNPINIGTKSVLTSGLVGDYDFRTVRSSWNSSTKTWTLTKMGS